MTPPVPFPDPPREIRPGFAVRLSFRLLCAAAAVARLVSWPRRISARRAQGGCGRKVLVLEPFGMGDAFLLQPLVFAWLDAGADVAFAGRPEWKALFPGRARFTYIPVKPGWATGSFRRKAAGLVADAAAVSRAIRGAAAGAHCICPRGDPRSIACLWLAGAADVATLPRYFSANDCKVCPLCASSFVPLDRMAPRRKVSRAFEPEGAVERRPGLAHLAQYMAAAPADGSRRPVRTVGLVPLSSSDQKAWPPENWRSLVRWIRSANLKPLLLCGPGEGGKAAAATGCDDLETREATDVGQWVAALDGCDVVVSVNTGPMHLADAMDKPLVVLDGPSRLPLWAPEGELAVVLHRQDAVPRTPVHFGGDGAAARQAMALVTPQMAIDALKAVIDKVRAAPPPIPANEI